MSAVETVEAEVDEVVNDYDERALTSSLPPLHDPGRPRAPCTAWPHAPSPAHGSLVDVLSWRRQRLRQAPSD